MTLGSSSYDRLIMSIAQIKKTPSPPPPSPYTPPGPITMTVLSSPAEIFYCRFFNSLTTTRPSSTEFENTSVFKHGRTAASLCDHSITRMDYSRRSTTVPPWLNYQLVRASTSFWSYSKILGWLRIHGLEEDHCHQESSRTFLWSCCFHNRIFIYADLISFQRMSDQVLVY